MPPVHLSPERIETSRLVLRPPVYFDGPGLHALLSDPVAGRYSPHALINDLAVTLFLIVEWDERRARGLRTFMVAPIERRRELFGFISVGPDGELGGLLSPRESGRGLATEALRAVIDALQLRDAWTIIDAEHSGLIHTLKNVGMKTEQRLPAFRIHPRLSALKRDCVLLRQQAGV